MPPRIRVRQILSPTETRIAPQAPDRPDPDPNPDAEGGDERETPIGVGQRPLPGSSGDDGTTPPSGEADGTAVGRVPVRRPSESASRDAAADTRTRTRTGLRGTVTGTPSRTGTGADRTASAQTTRSGLRGAASELSKDVTRTASTFTSRGRTFGGASPTARISAEDLIGPIPSDFPIETLSHIAVESQARGYAMLPNNQVGDSMLLFGVFFCSTLVLSFFFIGVMRRWEARHKAGQMEDAVIRDDMRWRKTGRQRQTERREKAGGRKLAPPRITRPRH